MGAVRVKPYNFEYTNINTHTHSNTHSNTHSHTNTHTHTHNTHTLVKMIAMLLTELRKKKDVENEKSFEFVLKS